MLFTHQLYSAGISGAGISLSPPQVAAGANGPASVDEHLKVVEVACSRVLVHEERSMRVELLRQVSRVSNCGVNARLSFTMSCCQDNKVLDEAAKLSFQVISDSKLSLGSIQERCLQSLSWQT